MYQQPGASPQGGIRHTLDRIGWDGLKISQAGLISDVWAGRLFAVFLEFGEHWDFGRYRVLGYIQGVFFMHWSFGSFFLFFFFMFSSFSLG